jgi:hypothetical protein
MKYLILYLLILVTSNCMAQSFSINTDGTTANTSAILDVKSTTKGMLIPRMSKTEKNVILSPATGLLIFQNAPDSIGFHYYDGSAWIWLESLANAGWKTKGNAGTDTAINFIGTTDNMPVRFKQNSQYSGQWDLNRGDYFIGKRAGFLKPASMQNSIAIGDSALAGIGTASSSDFSIAVGYKALKNHQSQIGNIAVGAFTLQNFVSNAGGGFGSVAVGYQAMNKLLSGEQNIAVGAFALVNDTTGTGNTATGAGSLGNKKKGNFNTAGGFNAGVTLRIGNNNTFLGANAYSSLDSLQNATAIGAFAQTDTSNAMVLGSINGINSATANVNVAIGTTKPKAALHVSRGITGNPGIIPADRISLFEDNASNYIQLLSPNAFETGLLAGNDSLLIKAGITFPADSSISFRAGGNLERVTIQNNGNTGVGNPAPLVRLHVSKNSLAGAQYLPSATTIFENGASLGNTSLQLVNTSNGDFGIISGTELLAQRSALVFKKDSSLYFNTGTSFAERMSINKAGFIGINNPVPKSLLHIAATGVNAASSYYFPENNLIIEDTTFNVTAGTITNATHLIANDNDASAIIGGSKQNPLTSSIVMRNNDRSLRFVTNATNANGVTADMIIDSTGKVGIGFTNPATSLGINGAVTYVQDNTNTANAATTTVTVGNRTFFRINSDAAPAARKLALSNGLFTGQMLIIQCIAAGVNGFRIDDADANIDIAGATLSLLVNDSITFIWDGNEWIELHRSDN